MLAATVTTPSSAQEAGEKEQALAASLPAATTTVTPFSAATAAVASFMAELYCVPRERLMMEGAKVCLALWWAATQLRPEMTEDRDPEPELRKDREGQSSTWE